MNQFHPFDPAPSQTLIVKNPNKPIFFKNINKKPNTNEKFSDDSLKNSIFFRKFKVNNINFMKKSNSLSPKRKFPVDHKIAKNDTFNLSKLKKTREISQECEIHLQNLYNKLREGSESETERLRICFKMIDSVFM